MRRWVCVIALLSGFARSDYAWSARPRLPVAIERPLESDALTGAVPMGAWWLLG